MKRELERLIERNRYSMQHGDAALRKKTAEQGQHPYAVVICCSDSRVIPEEIFSAGIGELFVIRVAGNVLGRHALGSIEYACAHLGCKLVVVLGHTGCGAVQATLSGEAEGYISDLTAEIRQAIGTERDPYAACVQNVRYGVRRVREAFADEMQNGLSVVGAVYDIRTGGIDWTED